jgi:hypothetical protein
MLVLATEDVDTSVEASCGRWYNSGGVHGGHKGPSVALRVIGLYGVERARLRNGVIESANGIDATIGASYARQLSAGGVHGGHKSPSVAERAIALHAVERGKGLARISTEGIYTPIEACSRRQGFARAVCKEARVNQVSVLALYASTVLSPTSVSLRPPMARI